MANKIQIKIPIGDHLSVNISKDKDGDVGVDFIYFNFIYTSLCNIKHGNTGKYVSAKIFQELLIYNS